MSTLSVDPASTGSGTTYWILTSDEGYSRVVRRESNLTMWEVAQITVNMLSDTHADAVLVDSSGVGGWVLEMLQTQEELHVPVFAVHGKRVRKVS